MTAPHTPRSPVSKEVSTELQRVVERWRQLPLDRALSHSSRVRALIQSLAERVDKANGVPPAVFPAASKVPDLGPATLMDQLTVLVYDASRAAVASTLAEDLVSLRRDLVS
jgi:hypothetical protein